jgi:hypothetical protein
MLHEKASHSELNSISLIGGHSLFPQWFWDDAKHRAAVEALPAGLNRMNGQAAELASLNEGFGFHAVVSLVTGEGKAL